MSKLSAYAEAKLQEAMERWARWCAVRSGEGLGWPHITITGKVMAGMPSTKCTLCDGRKKIPGWKVGVNRPWVECPRCSGDGRIKADPTSSSVLEIKCDACQNPKTGTPMGEVDGKTCIKCKGAGLVTNHAAAVVNPAFIRSTAPPRTDLDDPQSQRIDWLICTALTEDQRVIVMYEYTRHGSQTEKARRLDISQGYYSQVLSKAHEILAKELFAGAA